MRINKLHSFSMLHIKLNSFFTHCKKLIILHELILCLLTYNQLVIFCDRITNASQT